MILVACLGKPDRPEQGASPDAPAMGKCDAKKCTDRGGACDGDTCVIQHSTQLGVTCPDGMPCKVLCGGKDACKLGGVNCGMATSCEVACDGDGACSADGVDCGASPACTVTCDGKGACRQGPDRGAGMKDPSVRCHMAACDVTCSGDASTCEQGIDAMGNACHSHCCDGACGTRTCATNDETCN